MPGLHFKYRFKAEQHVDSRFRQSIEMMRHLPDYFARTLYEDRIVTVDLTGYRGYPTQVLRSREYTAFFEGLLYDAPVEDFINQLFSTFHGTSDQNTAEADLVSLLGSVDGDFWVIMHDITAGQWHILNDLLGRLPVYCMRNQEVLVLSREMTPVSAVQTCPTIDPLSAAEAVLFGYSLGDRTILKDVRRLVPGSHITIKLGSTAVAERQLKSLRFDNPADSRLESEELVSIFLSACRNRSRCLEPLTLGLSGGHDSRAVAAGLTREHSHYSSYTWTGQEVAESVETSSARQVSSTLGGSWNPVATRPPVLRDALRIVKEKGGDALFGNCLRDPLPGAAFS